MLANAKENPKGNPQRHVGVVFHVLAAAACEPPTTYIAPSAPKEAPAVATRCKRDIREIYVRCKRYLGEIYAKCGRGMGEIWGEIWGEYERDMSEI